LVVPLSFFVIGKLIEDRKIPLPGLTLTCIALVSIGLFPGLPAIMRTPALAQIFGFSMPMYGLLGLALTTSMSRERVKPDSPWLGAAVANH
jgi:hypothetical protein